MISNDFWEKKWRIPKKKIKKKRWINLNLAILRVGDLFWMVSSRDPLQRVVGDLQLGDEKVTAWITW